MVFSNAGSMKIVSSSPMSPEDREELERSIRQSAEQRDFTGATTLALRGYGPEIFRFLLSLHRSEQTASDVFSVVAEGLWRAMETFTWEHSFRALRAVARRASLRHRRDEGRRARRQMPLELSALSAVEEQVRTQTLTFLRTEVRDRFAEIRDSLPPDDRALLILRIDRELTWNDLALAMHDDEAAPLAGDELKKAAARLRKRFQIVKEKLVEIGRSEGLLQSGKDRS
jgi:RNA polymerase sigma-70 factor, ECF subfamily